MYSIFSLPQDFLHKKYTKDQTDLWKTQMYDAAFGSGDDSISEELTPSQKKKVDSWGGPSYDVHRQHTEVFGRGVERLYEPYDSSKDVIHHNNSHNIAPRNNSATHKVIQSLLMKGYTTENYSTGLVSHFETPTKKIKISKALDLTGLKDQDTTWKENKRTPAGTVTVEKSGTIQKAYTNDPTRSAALGAKGIVFTRNQYDVAGMSTDRGWSSCMNMVDGSNKKYLRHDIDQGTLTAYFVHHDDQGIAHPVGRINLKRFANGSGHSIYRPEHATYGTVPDGVIKHVHEWSEKHYPSEPGLYMKHAALYNDDGNSTRFEKADQIKIASSHKNHEMMANTAKHVLDFSEENQGSHNWDVPQDSPKLKALDAVQQFANKIKDANPIQHTHQVIHSLIDHAQMFDGDRNDKNRFSETYDADLDGDDVVHHWAHEEMDGRSSSSAIKSIIKNPEGMSADDAFAHHAKIHEIISKTDNPEAHRALKEIHGMLMHKIATHGTDAQKDTMISNVMSTDDSDRKEYYQHLMDHESVPFDHAHPAELTSNPRLLHQIIKNNGDDVDHFPHFDHYKHDVLVHIGKHIDEKGAHEMMHDSNMSEDHRDSLVQGLNDNHHGEHIQHSLTSEMMLSGGHAKYQSTQLPTGAVKQHHIIRTIDPSTKFGERIHHNIEAYPSVHHGGFQDPISDDDHTDKFRAIAENTKYKSVLHKLKNRDDTKDHPTMVDAFDNNTLKESVKSLKEFLKGN